MHAGSDHDRCGDRQASHGDALDRIAIHGNIQCLAYADVLERILALDVGVQELRAELVETDEDGAHFHSVEHFELGVVAQPRDVLGGQIGHEVDIACEKRGDARGIGLDGRVDHVGHIALQLVPPRRIGR